MLLRGAPSVTWRLAQATSRPQAAARLAQPATSPCLAQHHRQRCSLLPCGASGQRRRACRARSGAAPPAETQEPEAAAWGADDLQRLRQEDEIEEEDALGEEWRSLFEDQLEELYMYAEEEEEKWNMVQDALDNVPQAQWQSMGLLEAANVLSPALVNELIGLGTWRLKGQLDPAIAFLAQRIEGTWREAFLDDLSMYPREAWADRFAICDSLDPENEMEGWSYSDMPDPDEGEPGYPRLLIENRIYSSRVFRKLHLEVACRQDGLQVLHMVMYPRYSFDLPIFAMDIVVAKGEVSLAIVDACPVRARRYLPPHYLQTMLELQQLFLPEDLKERAIPEWGADIFSQACVCIRPRDEADLAGFLKYAVALHRAHCALAKLVSPLAGSDPQQQARLQELLRGHKRFVDNQLVNKKTSRVLEVAFGPEWTSEYMTRVMFDFSPGDEPPCEDTSLVELYRYFEQHPEAGNSRQQLFELRAEVAVKRASEVLTALAAGQPVRQDRVEEALQVLYALDPQFQENCNVLFQSLGDAPESPAEVGAFLARNLPALGFPEPLPRWTATGQGVQPTPEKEEEEDD